MTDTMVRPNIGDTVILTSDGHSYAEYEYLNETPRSWVVRRHYRSNMGAETQVIKFAKCSSKFGTKHDAAITKWVNENRWSIAEKVTRIDSGTAFAIARLLGYENLPVEQSNTSEPQTADTVVV
jgi:hypothetical protein